MLLTAGLFAMMVPSIQVQASFIEPKQQSDDGRQPFEVKVLKLAETYTPEQVAKWKQELARRSELRAKLLKLKHERNMQMKREEHKYHSTNQQDQTIEKMNENNKNHDTSRKHHAWSEHRKQWKEEGRRLRNQLDEAVKSEDREQIVAALNALLQRLVEGNEMLDKRVQELQANMP
jgi:actin-related protein